MTRLKKLAILCHRWMGVTFCLLFLWWFVSGIFMMYWGFPSVEEADRLARSQPLDASQVRFSPDEAYAGLSEQFPPDAARLATFDGRPAYFFRSGRTQSIVYADNGQPLTGFPPELNLRTAAAWTGQPAGQATVRTITEVDQWTIEAAARHLLPLVKYSWPDGEQVYISPATGEVVQYTTRASRLFAHFGAIPHWLYYTPLRKNGWLWSRIVIGASGLATTVALLGLIVGIWMYSPSKRYRMAGNATGIPYAGQKRLHMTLGLFFGIVACTWAFSGMLSMDPFPVRDDGDSARKVASALRGGEFRLGSFDAKHPRDALVEVGSQLNLKRLDFAMFAGEPVYLATQDPHHTRIIPVHSAPRAEFDAGRIQEILRKATAPAALAEFRAIDEYDAYYRDRHRQLPLPVLLARFADADNTRFYIDPRTARLVGFYNSRSWIERWLYHGLHSFDFPWLYKHRPAWDLVVLALLLGGASLSVTSVIIGFQLLRRKLA
jgi:hypothetical protein